MSLVRGHCRVLPQKRSRACSPFLLTCRPKNETLKSVSTSLGLGSTLSLWTSATCSLKHLLAVEGEYASEKHRAVLRTGEGTLCPTGGSHRSSSGSTSPHFHFHPLLARGRRWRIRAC